VTPPTVSDLRARPAPPMPAPVAWAWAAMAFSIVVPLQIPGLPLTITPLVGAPCILYAYSRLGRYRGGGLAAILWAQAIGLAASALVGSHGGLLYINAAFWLVSAYSTYLLLQHPRGQRIAFRSWALGVAFLAAVRAASILGFAVLGDVVPQERNGFGFLVAVFAGSTYLYSRQRWGQRAGSLVFVGLIAILLMNGSRGSLLTALVVLSLVVWSVWRGRRAIRLMIVVPAVVATFAALLPFLAEASPELQLRLTAYQQKNARVLYSGTLDLRNQLAQKSWELFRREPILGVGLGQWAEIRDTSVQPYLDSVRLSHLAEHNSYLSWLAETGLLGTVPLLILMLWALRYVYRSLRAYERYPDARLLVGVSLVVAILIELFFVANIVSAGSWMALVSGGALYRSVRTQARTGDQTPYEPAHPSPTA
jgi:O-antigen ligase